MVPLLLLLFEKRQAMDEPVDGDVETLDHVLALSLWAPKAEAKSRSVSRQLLLCQLPHYFHALSFRPCRHHRLQYRFVKFFQQIYCQKWAMKKHYAKKIY